MYSYLASRSSQISDKDFEDALRTIEGTPDPGTLDFSEMD